MNKLPQIRSVRARMLVVLLPLVALAITALTLTAINRATAAETASRFSVMRQITGAGANAFDADAHANQALGRSLAAMLQGLGNGVTRAQVNTAVEQFQDRNPELAGTYVGFEPNAFDGADAAHRGTPGSDEKGRFGPYWNTLAGTKTLDYLVDQDTSDYWNVPKETGEGRRHRALSVRGARC